MRRGDIWTVSGGKDYAGNPRPVVIVQDDSFDATDSITVCAFTTRSDRGAPVPGCRRNQESVTGLRSPSRLMVDKITTVPKSKVGQRIGRLDDEDVVRAQPSGDGVPGPGDIAENGPEEKMMRSPGYSRRSWRMAA